MLVAFIFFFFKCYSASCTMPTYSSCPHSVCAELARLYARRSVLSLAAVAPLSLNGPLRVPDVLSLVSAEHLAAASSAGRNIRDPLHVCLPF